MIRTTLSICALFGSLVLLSGLLAQSSAPVRVSEKDSLQAPQRQATPIKPEHPDDERLSAVIEPETFSVLVEEKCSVLASHEMKDGSEKGAVVMAAANDEQIANSVSTDLEEGGQEAKLLPSLSEEETAAGRGKLLDAVIKPAKDMATVPSNPMRSAKREGAAEAKTATKRGNELVAMRGGRRFGLGGQDSGSKEPEKVGSAPTDPNQEAGPMPSLSEEEPELAAEGSRDAKEPVSSEEMKEADEDASEKSNEETSESPSPASSPKEEGQEDSKETTAQDSKEPTESTDKNKEKSAGEPTPAKGARKTGSPTLATKGKPLAEESTEEKTSEENSTEEATEGTLKPVGPEKPTLKSADELEPLTIELVELQDRLQDALAYYYQRPENVATRSPWGSMHAMIAYGVDSELIAGNRKVNAIGWLCYNGTCNGQRLFFTDRGQLQAQIGPGVQGHAGQFLSMLAQSRVQTDYPIRVDGQNFTVASLIEYEKLTCKPKTELTFKLIALSHYLQSDETWLSQDRQEWGISRLIKEELAQPIVGAACGGTHRLTGLSYAVKKRKQRGETIEGQWQRADTFIQDFHEYTFRLQNPDGSFSTEWFKGRGDNGPPSRRLETTGHVTEWLAFSLSDKELRDPKMIKSVSYLTNLLLEGRTSEKWSIGPLGHGLHALAMYDERVFGNKPGMRKQELAGRRLTVDRK